MNQEYYFAEGLFGRIGEYFTFLFSGMSWISILWILFWLVAFEVWLYSGFLAADVAEKANNPITKHFLLGLLKPYSYHKQLAATIVPVKLRTIEDDRQEKEQQYKELENKLTGKLKYIRRKQEIARAERRGSELGGFDVDEVLGITDHKKVAEEQQEKNAVESAHAAVYNQEFFQDLAEEDNTEFSGEFLLTLKDGTEYEVVKVMNFQETLATFVIKETGKKIRFKYENIADFAVIEPENEVEDEEYAANEYEAVDQETGTEDNV